MDARRTMVSSTKGRLGRAVLIVLALMAVPSGPNVARGQEGVSSYRKPVLMVETEGHHAPVRGLIWPDSTSLLSAGLDKVVKQWDLNQGPTLARTIRPPVWRGPGGIIYAIALSPWKNDKGQKLLAVAGYGVDSTRGDFTIYPYPGPIDPAAGEPLARLMPPKDAQALGQRNTVLTLAFNPKSQSLATAGANGVVTIWNTAAFRPIQALKGHQGAIRALAYLPDGLKLVTIGEDKTLRVWDLGQGVEVGRYQGVNLFNALAISADGASIFAGTERGELYRFDPADVRIPRLQLPTLPVQGAIESIAVRPDGLQLLTSIVANNADMTVASDRMVACDIELRDLPTGKVVWTRRLPGLVYATSFRPDGKAFAYSGGSDQAIHLQELADLERPPTLLKGKGTTVYDVGFTADSRGVGFSRTLAPRAAGAEIDGFDLAARKALRLPPGALRQAVNEFNGWTIQGSINRYQLEAVQAGVVRWRLDLDPGLERLWWSYTFVPPGPGHPKPTLAVGTESGVVVFDLETGKRTRAFAGHSSPVVSLAPSPDGRWLASGSVDQTLMVYPLDGVDVRPAMGLTLAASKTGRVVVSTVEPRGFAGLMGAVPGDVVIKAMLARGKTGTIKTDPAGLLDLAKQADDLEPQTAQLGLWLRRTQLFGPLAGFTFDLPPLPSLKRNNPALSLMLDVEREWVLWTPQGYYETSIEGDTRLLGWHVNAPYDQPKANDFLPIVTFQDTMRRPNLLGELWRLGDIDRAVAAVLPASPAPVAVAYDEQPPRIAIKPVDPPAIPAVAGQPFILAVAEARILVAITPQGESSVGGWEALVDQQRLTQRDVKGLKGAVVTEELRIPLTPNRPVRLAVEARNLRGVARTETLDLVYIPPPAPKVPEPKPEPKKEAAKPKPRPSRLELIAVGTQHLGHAALAEIPFADSDTRDLAPFLSSRLFPVSTTAADRTVSEPLVLLNQGKATTSQLREDLDQLLGRAKEKQLRPGDAVALVIVANGLETPEGLMLALSDTEGKKTLAPLIAANDISERLGELATDYGCRVALFLDLIHGDPTDNVESGPKFKAWVRDLYQNRQVIVFIASKEGPSLEDTKAGHGLFAIGLLGAFEQVGASAGIRDRSADYSLLQFKTAVVDRVLEQSGRRQQVGCYIPRSVSQKTKFASPLSAAPPSR